MKREILHIGSRWSKIFVYAATALGPLGLVRSSSAQAVPRRFVIDASQIVDAMREGRLPIEGVTVHLAAPVTASVAAARIAVASVSLAGPHEVRLRLTCSDHSECLPFFAVAAYRDGVDVSTLHTDRSTKVAADRQPELQSPVLAVDASRSVKNVARMDAGMLRAGTTAMLELEAEKIHVRIEVISLQSGVPGNRVRVSSVDHKQVYTAEVITPTLLKGELAK